MTRFELWKDWNKHCTNHPVYKFLVLLGLVHSPTFEIHKNVKEMMDRHPELTYSIQEDLDEDNETYSKTYTVNWGWYGVYFLMVMTSSAMCTFHNFDIFTWQYWVHFLTVMLSFVAGSYYRKED